MLWLCLALAVYLIESVQTPLLLNFCFPASTFFFPLDTNCSTVCLRLSLKRKKKKITKHHHCYNFLKGCVLSDDTYTDLLICWRWPHASSTCWCHSWIWVLFVFPSQLEETRNSYKLTDKFMVLNSWFYLLVIFGFGLILVCGLVGFLFSCLCFNGTVWQMLYQKLPAYLLRQLFSASVTVQ